jgi:hypothetical protein
MNSLANTADPFAPWIGFAEWRATLGERMFPTESSGRWFFRKNRQRLLELAVAQYMGARLVVHGEKLPVAVLHLERARTRVRLLKEEGTLEPAQVEQIYADAVAAAREEMGGK